MKQPVHIAECKYSSEPLTPRSQEADDCCCPVPSSPVIRCQFVTGSSSRPMDWKARRGPKRLDGRYDVLCGYVATWLVERPGADSIPTCNRDLPHVIDQQAVVTRIPSDPPDAPKPDAKEVVRRIKEKT